MRKERGHPKKEGGMGGRAALEAGVVRWRSPM